MDIAGVLDQFVAEPVRQRSPWLFGYRLGRFLNDRSKGRTDERLRSRHAQPITDQDAADLDRDGILVRHWPKDYAGRDAYCRQLFEAYYGVPPRYYMEHSWVSTPSSQPTEARWHRDNTSAMTFNTFTYQCDVGEKNGPHQYQLGSHRDPVKRFAPDDNSQSPAARVLTVTGAAGTTFIDLSHGLHRATHATEGQRITYEVLYSYHAFPGAKPIGR